MQYILYYIHSRKNKYVINLDNKISKSLYMSNMACAVVEEITKREEQFYYQRLFKNINLRFDTYLRLNFHINVISCQ